MKRSVLLVILIALSFVSCENQITYEERDGYKVIHQSRGATLGYTSAPILTVEGLAFKDLNRNGNLDLYEDWRVSAEDRAKDLASKLPIERICGLMLYSGAVDADSTNLTDKQLTYLRDDYIRHMLVRSVKDARTAVTWSNNIQA